MQDVLALLAAPLHVQVTLMFDGWAMFQVTTTQLVGPDVRVQGSPEAVHNMWQTSSETLLHCKSEAEPKVWEGLPSQASTRLLLEDHATLYDVRGPSKLPGWVMSGEDLCADLQNLLWSVWECEQAPEEERLEIVPKSQGR